MQIKNLFRGRISPSLLVVAVVLGMALAMAASVVATTVGTNVTVSGTVAASATTGSSSVTHAFGVGTSTPGIYFSVGGAGTDTTGHGYFTGGLGVGRATTTSGNLELTGSAYVSGDLSVTDDLLVASGLGVGLGTTTTGMIENSANALFGDAAADLVMYNAASHVYNNAGTSTILAASEKSWSIATSSANIPFLRYDTSAYRIGLGTTTPGATLSVVGDAYVLNGLGVGLATTSIGTIQNSGNTLLGDAAADLVMLNAASLILNNSGTTTIIAASEKAWSIATSSANIPFVRYDTSAYRIGLGTTTPGATFSVVGDAYILNGFGVGLATTSIGTIENSGNTLLGDAAGDFVALNAASLIHNNVGTTTLVAADKNSWNVATTSANIPFVKYDTSNYRIGIGTSTPGRTFSVAGEGYFQNALSVGTNGTRLTSIQWAWIDCGPLNTASFPASTTMSLQCNTGIPQGHAAGDPVWLTASSSIATTVNEPWYSFTGEASSTGAGKIQVEIENDSGRALTQSNVGTTSWQLLLIK